MPSTAELRTQYLGLQQEADFALWRARETSLEVRRLYQLAVDGAGPPPSAEQLAELRQLETQAESKYRDLRAFLREHFEQLAVLA